MHQITTGAMSPDGLHDCAFLWLWCRDGRPYAKYLPEGASEHMPMVLTLLRWDGTFGTMGGKVDKGESLMQALFREAGEEIGFWLPDGKNPEPLGTFQDGPWHIHSFSLEMSYYELLGVRTDASALKNASPEVAGVVLAPTGQYRPGKEGVPRGRTAFEGNQFCSTAKLEWDLLMTKLTA